MEPASPLLTRGTPRVSVGMPVRDGERFIRLAIESILAQTLTDFELIISDNCSTDGTRAICREYLSDPRVRYFPSAENLGGAWNHNRVFELSRAPYFKWAAHDDECAPEFLERCVAALDSDPSLSLCFTKTILIDDSGVPLQAGNGHDSVCYGSAARSKTPSERLLESFRCASTWCNPFYGVIRSSVLRATTLVGPYFEADLVLLAQLALTGECRELPEPLFFRRDHPQRAIRVAKTARERALWYDSAHKGPATPHTWKLLTEYLASVRRAPLSVADRLRCYWVLAKWCRWSSGELATEALGTLRGVPA